MNLIQAAALKSACPIHAVDNNSNKRDLCFIAGATIFTESIDELTEKVDVIIDTTGIPEVISSCVSKLSGKGRMILVGQPCSRTGRKRS